MNAERAREFLLSLPDVVETSQFGGLVYWVGDKAIGGKMFAWMALEREGRVMSFPVGQERFHEWLELDGIIPSPYMARIFWVAAERWSAMRDGEWHEALRTSHEMTLDKLPTKAKRHLALARTEQRKLLAEARKVAKLKSAAKKS